MFSPAVLFHSRECSGYLGLLGGMYFVDNLVRGSQKVYVVQFHRDDGIMSRVVLFQVEFCLGGSLKVCAVCKGGRE